MKINREVIVVSVIVSLLVAMVSLTFFSPVPKYKTVCLDGYEYWESSKRLAPKISDNGFVECEKY